jgi:hypothetical protein
VRSQRTIFGAIAIGLYLGYQAIVLSDDTIRTTGWKYNDDLQGYFPHSDFLYFDKGGLLLRNDTIYRADTVLAVVCCAYHKPFTYDRLIIKVIASGRKVEYVAM